MARLDIAEVVEQAGVPASTLRYYEEKGLIMPIGRSGLRRVFCLLYTSPSPRDRQKSRMPSSA